MDLGVKYFQLFFKLPSECQEKKDWWRRIEIAEIPLLGHWTAPPDHLGVTRRSVDRLASPPLLCLDSVTLLPLGAPEGHLRLPRQAGFIRQDLLGPLQSCCSIGIKKTSVQTPDTEILFDHCSLPRPCKKISNAPNHQTTKDNPTQEERFTEIRIVSVFFSAKSSLGATGPNCLQGLS